METELRGDLFDAACCISIDFLFLSIIFDMRPPAPRIQLLVAFEKSQAYCSYTSIDLAHHPEAKRLKRCLNAGWSHLDTTYFAES